jgi:hypothetical protein
MVLYMRLEDIFNFNLKDGRLECSLITYQWRSSIKLSVIAVNTYSTEDHTVHHIKPGHGTGEVQITSSSL